MGRKAYTFLACWFVIVGLVTCLAYVPLSFWLSYIRPYIPNTVTVSQLTGYWWDGKARLMTNNLRGPVDLSWSIDSLLDPVSWRLSHEKFQGVGLVKIRPDQLEFWVDSFNLHADMFNGLLQPERVAVHGAPVSVSRWYAKWQFSTQKFEMFRGSAQWATGAISYPMGRNIKTSTFENWSVEGRLKDGFPELVLRSQENRHLGDAKLLPSDELEVTVMPAMVEALGQRWRGSKDYPAFVMIQSLL
ncbi:hypothetical protein DN730_09425 [Marinomonas piezotolerans]|uniref:Type II secretion system protein N n=1 Tax=Marinomonas piezotolerans TaxID=2213058 RepID=A0A370U9Y8_9GAMM|nr:hypothetical protein [Marinomonas piezotolerans]RDL44599.1 hypothetical protein DN730_09425 [Marinomonas piezotolerans]